MQRQAICILLAVLALFLECSVVAKSVSAHNCTKKVTKPTPVKGTQKPPAKPTPVKDTLPANGVVLELPSGTYRLFGYEEQNPTKPEHFKANATEAKANCTRMGMEQPDANNKDDLLAATYLDANGASCSGTCYGTWIKTRAGDTCTYVDILQLYQGQCAFRLQYVCVKRKPKPCGQQMCCGAAKCCGGRICCHYGTTCCPATVSRNYTMCVEGKQCPA